MLAVRLSDHLPGVNEINSLRPAEVPRLNLRAWPQYVVNDLPLFDAHLLNSRFVRRQQSQQRQNYLLAIKVHREVMIHMIAAASGGRGLVIVTGAFDMENNGNVARIIAAAEISLGDPSILGILRTTNLRDKLRDGLFELRR